MNNTDILFIVVKTCVGSATLFVWADYDKIYWAPQILLNRTHWIFSNRPTMKTEIKREHDD